MEWDGHTTSWHVQHDVMPWRERAPLLLGSSPQSLTTCSSEWERGRFDGTRSHTGVVACQSMTWGHTLAQWREHVLRESSHGGWEDRGNENVIE